MFALLSAPVRGLLDVAASPDAASLDGSELAEVTRRVAGAGHWESLVRHNPDRRFHERIIVTALYDAWLIGWSPGQAVPAHDHGASVGALVVTRGQLSETTWPHGAEQPLTRTANSRDEPMVFPPGHIHAVANLHGAPATSIHLYSPPLDTMRWFDEVSDPPPAGAPNREPGRPPERRSVETVLRAARAQLDRLQPADAYAAVRAGALLIDTRPASSRGPEGELPGAIVVERNDLEWRLDPNSPDRLSEISSYHVPIVVVCNDGYASSLAAVSLQHLGLSNVTDLAGGFRAWKRAGLPTRDVPHASS